ncbi:hypothetical protein GQ607_015922 [Colletotrichum asianum]|uniref:Uncharacterized protein n=1 Tax=Colletotrichum asianum TaxID=702518 RepID=A0A8H3W229_9PEZI|nr:hypothetical protein GQ607_015922 [Colletotrichum asianum]
MYCASMRSISRYEKVQKLLKAWVVRNNMVDPSRPLTFQCMAFPQQADGFNCGVFAIETVRRLVHGLDVFSPIRPTRCRQEWARALSSPRGIHTPSDHNRISDKHTAEVTEVEAEAGLDRVVKEKAIALFDHRSPHRTSGKFGSPRRDRVSNAEARISAHS